MARFRLILGNKNYSSWSLRGYLAVAMCTEDFEELVVPLFEDGYKETLAEYTPVGLVPALEDGELAIWDSLAIAEYMAEQFPEAGAWPEAPAARAVARSVTAEMHSGFTGLRTDMPMNIRRRAPGVGHSEAALADAARVQKLWRDCRSRFGAGGDFLFGRFSIADCFYAPVVMRFRTYGVEVDEVGRAYMDAILAHAKVRAWCGDADAETWCIPRYE